MEKPVTTTDSHLIGQTEIRMTMVVSKIEMEDSHSKEVDQYDIEAEDIEDEADEFEYDFDDEEDNDFDMEDEMYDKDEKVTTPLAVGCFTSDYNDKVYHPWTLRSFISNKYLSKMTSVQNHLPQLSYDDLLIMLQYKKWQPDEVINGYFDDSERTLQACGLPLPGEDRGDSSFQQVDNFSCPICCEEYLEPITVYGLSCKHQYCFDCYNNYINHSITSGKLISCIEPSCSLIIPHKDIDKLLKFKEPNQLLIAHAKAFIDQNSDRFRWCPSTDCGSFTEMIKNYDVLESGIGGSDYESDDISKVPIVTCIDRHEFCFNCNFENHLPCPCWIVKLWIKKCQDDSETAHWIEANTHSCPKCEASIEKNGGCNHMTCEKCRHEFCWICLGEWADHKTNYYTCNKFKEGDNKDVNDKKSKSRISLQRYLHFYKRFSIHESSMKGDLSTLKKVNEVTKLYMEDRRNEEKNLSWNDIQFLTDAIRALIIGRKTLKWTYCFAFYLAKGNFSEIFESKQDFLSKTVEDLSEVFEKIISKRNLKKVETIMKEKNKIINLSDLIVSRKRLLIKGAIVNVNENLLRFDTYT